MKNKTANPLWQKIVSPEAVALMKLIHSFHRGILPAEIGKNMLEALKPFINIVCSALILDGLIAGESAASVMKIVCWMVSLNLITALLIALLDWLRKSYLDVWCISQKKFSERALQLDYERLEETETRDMIRMHDETRNMYGGIPGFCEDVGRTVKSFFSIVYSFGLMLPFFFTRTVQGKGMVAYLFTSPVSSVLVLTVLTASIYFSLIFFKKKERKVKEYWEYSLDFTRKFRYFHFLISKYQNGKDIRSYHMSDLLYKGFQEVGRGCSAFLSRQAKLEEIIGGNIIIISQIAVPLFYILVGMKALFGAITVGSILQYVGALSSFYESFTSLMTDLTEMNICANYSKCEIDFFSIENKKYEGQLPVEKRDDNEYELEFRDVSFAYPGTEKKILDHVSFKFKVGSKLALVGKNGAGKTTFIKLLCRLYDPTEGQILLNGIDIKKYDYQEYQSLFSVVFQDFKLFSFELGQNVAASVDYEEERVWDSLDKAGIGDRVRRMKEGLQTVLYQAGDDGVEISGGEAQKIAIARALYKDTPVIILDEPTSALDPISEYEIYSKFDTLVSDKTAIYISHRMSSCRFCDNIAVFDNGTVREMGSHESLMKKKGLYYKMWESQAKYYSEKQMEEFPSFAG